MSKILLICIGILYTVLSKGENINKEIRIIDDSLQIQMTSPQNKDHAMLFVQYLQNNNAKVILEAIDKPDKEYTKLNDPLIFGLEHEEYVTSLIHNLYDAAYSVKDFRTMQFLDWFVKEQGEEETNANDLITKFNLFGSDSRSLYLLDSELAARVYSAPSLVL